jgi:hypothetical protein|tara:strand:+ start:2217 stop:2723 length:507 start_codon:yes stop_codon:yes gene_type:complete
MIKIIDNFLDKEDFERIYNMFNSNDFPWYYSDWVNGKGDNPNDFQFIHLFYSKVINSKHFEIIEPLIVKLEMTSISRIKANLLLKTDTPIVHGYHTDFDWKYKWWTAIYYVNSNNGRTIFKKNKKSVYCKANRLVLFDGRLPHCSVTSTNTKKRIVINLNFFNKQLED